MALLVTAACVQRPSSLVLLDSVSRAPVPGALVYAPGELTVYRSDVHGVVALPAGYGDSGIRVFAKNYQPFVLPGSAGSDEVLLTYDESLVNPVEARLEFGKADTLRGSYGPYRENNDLLSYDLNIKVNVEEKFLSGWNTIRFRMVEDGNRIQLDLFENMTVDGILLDEAELDFSREHNAVFVDFPMMLTAGEEYSIDFHYSGHPVETGRFGGFTFSQDSLGNPWIFNANQGIGASLWWPNKDQQPDEVEEMTINVTVPSGLVDASNGRLMEVRDLGDGTTEYRWKVHYPINNYSVSVNIGTYTHFTDTLGELTLDFYALPYHLEEATNQFAQAKPMLQCFSDRFGEYPFMEDGYKLIEAPYSGMEHQSAVTYGNLFRNGYMGRDWTGSGHQHPVRLHHHPRERPRVVRKQRNGQRCVRCVDPRGVGYLGRGRVRGVLVGLRGRHDLHQRLQGKGGEPGAHHRAHGGEPLAHPGSVLQGRPLHEHAPACGG